MARWRDEDLYDGIVRLYSQKYGVPFALVKAIIAAESGFNPLAIRKEAPRASLPPTKDFPQGGDESRGLMQLLVRTARALGYTGDMVGLYNAATNIELGTKHIAGLLKATGNKVEPAISGYNAGLSAERPGDGKRVGGATTPFINQAYVDRVLEYMFYFAATAAAAQGAASGGTVPASTAGGPSGGAGLSRGALLAIAAALLLILLPSGAFGGRR